MAQYLPVLMMLVLATLFAVISRLVSKLMAPSRPNAAKEAPYECGIVPSREPPERFPVRFYLVAMLFIMFDIEIVFLYPYAVSQPRARYVRLLRDRALRARSSSSRSCTRSRRAASNGVR